MQDYIVWNGFSREYVTLAESPIRAIQNAIAASEQFIPANLWNVIELDSFSPKIQKKAVFNAIRI